MSKLLAALLAALFMGMPALALSPTLSPALGEAPDDGTFFAMCKQKSLKNQQKSEIRYYLRLFLISNGIKDLILCLISMNRAKPVVFDL